MERAQINVYLGSKTESVAFRRSLAQVKGLEPLSTVLETAALAAELHLQFQLAKYDKSASL